MPSQADIERVKQNVGEAPVGKLVLELEVIGRARAENLQLAMRLIVSKGYALANYIINIHRQMLDVSELARPNCSKSIFKYDSA